MVHKFWWFFKVPQILHEYAIQARVLSLISLEIFSLMAHL